MLLISMKTRHTDRWTDGAEISTYDQKLMRGQMETPEDRHASRQGRWVDGRINRMDGKTTNEQLYKPTENRQRLNRLTDRQTDLDSQVGGMSSSFPSCFLPNTVGLGALLPA